MDSSKPRVTAAVMGLIGLILAAGGAWLAILGGSWGYLAIGAGCFLTAVLLWRGHRSAVTVYWSLLLAIYGWALWEIGFDGWALMPRVVGPTVVGLWLLTPFLRRGLADTPATLERRLTSGFALVCAIALVGGLIARAPGWERNIVQAPAAGAPAPTEQVASASTDEWRNFGGDVGGTRFSGLTDLTPANVPGLKVAWTAHLGSPDLEVTPLKVANTLYVCNALNVVKAIDAETGEVKWTYDPKADLTGVPPHRCRGVAFYDAGPTAADCPQRIIAAVLDARLVAIDAVTGRLCPSFGKQGMVDLKQGMGPMIPGYYSVTSAPAVVSGKVVVGGWVTDNQFVGEPSGVVRAYDAKTGELAWAWDVGRAKDAPPGAIYTPSTPNVWGSISGDESLGLVYLPVGNATPDYYGGNRSPASDSVSSSVVALDIATGAVRWVFQTAHHDVWDYDVTAQPTLLDVKDDKGVVTPALIETTKRGELFLLDRRTGVPISRVEERPAPAGGYRGEHLSPTQPYSIDLPSVAGPKLTERDMWGVTPFDQLWCRIQYRRARYDGQFTPPGGDARPSIEYPGLFGGSNWGGVSVDPERHLAVVNTMRMANYVRIVPRAEADAMGVKPMGLAPNTKGAPAPIGIGPQLGTPFAIWTGPWLSALQMPCQRPPFGMITVVDLSTRKVMWSQPLGTSHDVGPFNIRLPLDLPMGSFNTGGSVTTRGGLVFIAATQEQTLRAFDINTGKIVWKVRLPAGGQATPMTYRSSVSGRQFVVIAAGGGSRTMRTRTGDYLIAYALPKTPAAP